jgi:hypothetical protein
MAFLRWLLIGVCGLAGASYLAWSDYDAHAHHPFDRGGAQAIGRALEQRLGASPQVSEVFIASDYMLVTASEPDHPWRMDHWDWQSGDTTFERTPWGTESTDRLFPLARVNLAAVPTLVQAAERLLPPDGRRIQIVVEREGETGESIVRFRVRVSNRDGDRVLLADADGTNLRQER